MNTVNSENGVVPENVLADALGVMLCAVQYHSAQPALTMGSVCLKDKQLQTRAGARGW